jgi:hypothetical protein
MSSFTDALRAIITNTASPETEKSEATASLKRLADAGGEDARQVLRELGLLTPQLSTYTVAKAKDIINDPASTPEQREAAWIKLKTPEDIPAEVRQLEIELLEEVSRGSIADVDYAGIHQFCTDREWKNPAVKSLFFDRWLPAYWKSEQGSRKLAELEKYKMMNDSPTKRGESDLQAMDLIAETRRRIRTDEEFCGQIAEGVSEDRIPLSFLTDVLLADLWQPTSLEQAVTAQ